MKFDDNFKGDNDHLLQCINALLDMDKAGSLVPHRIGGHGRTLLSAAAARLSAVREATTQADASDPEAKGNISAWLRRRMHNDLVMIPGSLAGQIADHIDALKSAAKAQPDQKSNLEA